MINLNKRRIDFGKGDVGIGEKGARDINEILEANRALFAGGELDEEAKDAFYQAVTKAYLSCKMEAKKTFGRKKKNTEMESDS